MEEKSKREQIEAIDNEVLELHPLLKEIFSKLPNITYVEYTHGPNEKGADFVLEKNDPVLGIRNYVGVVAKSDKILQNFSDVERQIDECGHLRFIRQGVLQVRLPEVWVITSKSVSQNAKDKIHEKFSSRSVLFFDSEWLAKKVDEFVPHFWDQLSNAIGSYLAQTDKRMSVINTQTLVPSGSLTLATFDVDVQEIEDDKYAKTSRSRKPRLINLFEEVLSNKISWLEADMGFGKSFLARRLVSHFCNTHVYKEKNIIPIFDSFKSFLSAVDIDLNQYIKRSLGNECARDAASDDATYLIVLDGVDEACSDIDRCKEAVVKLTTEARANDKVRLLITSRPLKPFEDSTPLTITVKRYQIRPLSLSKIIGFLKKVLETGSIPNKLLDDLGRSDLFKQLPQNPIAASLLANLIAQQHYELPSNLTELYAKTIELMMGRWDEKRQVSTEKLYKATERLARYAARHMVDNQLIYISKSEMREMFRSFLDERNIGVPLDEACDYLLNRSGLFGIFPDTDVVFFKHRSFAEYLYARDAYETRNFEIDERAFHPYWANTYFFYVGSLGECPDILNQLVEKQPTSDSSKFLRFINVAGFLLAGYQTPYTTIEESLEVILKDAAKMYIECREGKMFPGLTALSEMQMLWFWVMTVRYYYGYKFFEKALPLVMARLDESMLDGQDEKVYALFFVASALRELDNDCGFEFLLKSKKPKDLPLAINLAMRAEINHSTKQFANSSIVKSYEKSLKKILYISTENKISSAAKMDSLFKEPLSKKIEAKKSQNSVFLSRKNSI